MKPLLEPLTMIGVGVLLTMVAWENPSGSLGSVKTLECGGPTTLF